MNKEELVQLLGYANEFKEGDLSIGVGTYDDSIRADAKQSLSRVRLNDIFQCDVIEDPLTDRLKTRYTAEQSAADAFSRINVSSTYPPTRHRDGRIFGRPVP